MSHLTKQHSTRRSKLRADKLRAKRNEVERALISGALQSLDAKVGQYNHPWKPEYPKAVPEEWERTQVALAELEALRRKACAQVAPQ